MFRFCHSLLVVLVSSISSVSFAQVLSIDPQTVEAKAWVILDPQSHQVIASYNENEHRAPASLTKMMVGYLSLQAVEQGKLNLEQIVTVPEVVTTVKGDESRLRLHPGDQISVQELISGLIIMSANDAALTLATLISGDIPQFLQLMNHTAQQLGMHNTQFDNPSGITMQNHYASAFDLALLSQAIVKNTPEYLNYSKQQEFSYKDIHHHATNILLKKDPSVDGLKTGYTEAAGYNLALTANRLDPNTNEYRRLIVVVMGTASKQKRADVAYTLMNIAYNYTQTKQLFRHDQIIADIPVIGGQKPIYKINLPQSNSYHTLSLLTDDMVLNAQQFDNTSQRFILQKSPLEILEPLKQPQQMAFSIQLLQQQLDAPLIHTAMPLAKINVTQFKKIIHEVDIVQDVALDQASWWHRLVAWIKSWIQLIQGHSIKAVIYPITTP
ncbi:D-alanyl-D-alanine carboxypeptidase family protein [Acinetobacter populi]|uniref:D-alanyl-D-alanine carboxypeptidase family protein n=1 Tax=Acinetobacter populi TaxID=1582270 RepID=UPI001FE76503|nr:D-alanyl-D-alanine carboxypeptidase family protein [Acinetobacter populi]